MMNRLAIVLAADSATTVTHWSERGKEERYFKGANKVFQLSNHHPIGLMIYDSADLLSVPWEVIVKEFRRGLASKQYDTVPEYAAEFFRFLHGNERLFPVAVQQNTLLEGAKAAVYRTVYAFVAPDGDAEGVKAAFDSAIARRRAEVNAMPWAPQMDEELAAQLIAEHAKGVGEQLAEIQPHLDRFPPTSSFEDLATLGILEVLKSPQEFLGKTGLVFAGFGQNDIFPSMVEYHSCGIIAGRHTSREAEKVTIDHTQPAWLSAFAQTAMIDTFQLGLSEDVYNIVLGALTENLKPLAAAVLAKAGADSSLIDKVGDEIATARRAIIRQMMDRAKENHAFPLRRVLGVLPVDEMAELAETLINLQSLKEKVTKPSETVGGPIDVAVITRSEGMVWIKRKLYFDQSLNSRYMQRQSMAHKPSGEDQ